MTGRARVDAAGLVERRRHRLHREARRRPPAERGLSGRLRHADQRLDHPLPLPRGLRAGGASWSRARWCEVTIELPPTSNLFDRGHRIRLDVSSSNFPRLDLNPNTGEPIGRHTHQVVAEQAVHGGTRDAARHSCDRLGVDSGGAVPDGDRPRRRLSAGRGRDAAAGRLGRGLPDRPHAGHRRRRRAADVRLARRGGGVLRRERRAAADRDRVGGGRPRRRRPALAVGRRAPRHDARDLRAGHRQARRRPGCIRRGPRRAARSTWRATSSSGRPTAPRAAART